LTASSASSSLSFRYVPAVIQRLRRACHAGDWFWLRHREAPLNERQRKALNLALSGSELDDDWLTNRRPQYAVFDCAVVVMPADYRRAGLRLWRIYRLSDLA
jgi:hypothetical protein